MEAKRMLKLKLRPYQTFSIPENKNLYKLHHNHELYLSCLENQYNIVNKYFNKEWLKNYILSKINIE